MRKAELWNNQKIDGWAARMSQLSIEEIDANREADWRYEAPLFQYTHKEDIFAFLREIYGFWAPLDDGGDSTFLDDPARERVTASKLNLICSQLIHSGEVNVDLSEDMVPFVNYGTLRAKMGFDAAKDWKERPDFRACHHCGGLFPVRRSDAKFCSGRCQTAFWRANRGAK
ncbi:hypothetical protein PH7735_00346 [Shimia thalassica]|uniref:Uncharacterized protein n=1 Tax=Shimia thalassica TaxID=1715693 RepID=A0A0P1IMD2_9RHOB|nr:hypothetical protein [Shimia thalassica]CUJ84169.1 hypothetical protein PH7735_00346 [Shimia thalassica]